MAPTLKSLVLALSCLGTASAVSMIHYEPAENVQPAFEPFLESLYEQAEAVQATTAFTDFFPAEGSLVVLTSTATGAKDILALKRALLPVDGSRAWNHLPNTTTIFQDTPQQTIYEVFGIIQTTNVGMNCSQAYYQSQFTVLKDSTGTLNFKPASGSLQEYNDMIVTPKSPTNIACKD